MYNVSNTIINHPYCDQRWSIPPSYGKFRDGLLFLFQH